MKPSLSWLLIFVPITLAVEHIGVPLPVLFFSAALALIPIAGLIVKATEQIALRTNDAVGGLLNATFGNAPELIIGMVALRAGLLDMVRASLIGAILANLLLALGLSFFLGGIRHHVQRFNPTAARTYSTTMLLASMSMGIPSGFSRYLAPDAFIREERLLKVGIAVLLLLAYGLYLWFSLATHPGEFASAESDSGEREHGKRWSWGRAAGTLVAASTSRMDERDSGRRRRGHRQSARNVADFHRNRFACDCGRRGRKRIRYRHGSTKQDGSDDWDRSGQFHPNRTVCAPMLVLTSYFLAPQPLNLSFGRAEVGSLFLGVILGARWCAVMANLTGIRGSNWLRFTPLWRSCFS